MRYLKVVLLAAFIFGSLAGSVQSKERDEDRFFYGTETDQDMQSVLPGKSFSTDGIQYGAIISPVYMSESGGDNELSSAVVNTKIWAKSYLWANSYMYASVKDSYMKIVSSSGDSYKQLEDKNIFDLEQAFVTMTFADAAFKFSAGRKYYNIGTGLVLNGRGDGAELGITTPVYSVKALGLYTGFLLKDNNPYGLSDKEFSDGAERVFLGGVMSAYAGNQHMYVFGLVQRDMSDQQDGKETTYNSEYFGAGIEGVVFTNISYYGEVIVETGESYINNTTANEKGSIAAYAANTGLNFFIPLPMNPAIIVQYAYGSGDEYRSNYITSNRDSGATGYDSGFISFGTFSGGYALKPVLSNIHIYRAGLSFAPFSMSDSMMLKKLSLSGKYSYYMKDEKSSPINDGTEATLNKPFIGQGMDFSLRWQMFYDASIYVNYGLFMPGDAYASKDKRSFAMAGVNLSI